jgi:hypothetical protein
MNFTFYFDDLIELWHAADIINENLIGDVCEINRVALTITCPNELAYETVGRLLAEDASKSDTADTAEEPQDEFREFFFDQPEMTDVEADADTLRSAGMGTDEDYEHNSCDEMECPE